MDSKYGCYVICDTETTGIPTKSNRAFYEVGLTEVAFVLVNENLEITEKKSWLIKPYSDKVIWNIEAEKVSGISKSMCEKEGQDIQIVCKEMSEFLHKSRDKGKEKGAFRLPVLVGHNFLSFDLPFLVNAFEFCKLDLSKFVHTEVEDTMKWSRYTFQTSVNYKLGTCCENFGITLAEAHRALPDTIATAKLWIQLMKNLRGKNDNNSSNIDKKEKRFRHGFEL